jgi:hypothetical protein
MDNIVSTEEQSKVPQLYHNNRDLCPQRHQPGSRQKVLMIWYRRQWKKFSQSVRLLTTDEEREISWKVVQNHILFDYKVTIFLISPRNLKALIDPFIIIY